MTTRGLAQLEDQRRDEVERASRELASLRHAHDAAVEARRVADVGYEDALALRRAAAQSFASARTVSALRAAELALCVATAALLRAEQRVAACGSRVRATAQALLTGEDNLRAGEVARRSVARTREQRAADVSLRKERQHEDERDDAFRAQFYARTPVSAGRGPGG